MIKCSTSLWSADMANLETEIKRVEPFSEQFHIDVADGHYVPQMLFFPDLVKAIRPHTTCPFEVHLMATDPLEWIETFVEAGADSILVSWSTADPDPTPAIERIKRLGKHAGIVLSLSDPVGVVEPFLDRIDMLVLLGTAVGIKGAGLDPRAVDRIRQAKRLIASRDLAVEVEADGGIRRETVPLLASAGIDWIVPGSLMFKEDPGQMRKWLDGLATSAKSL
jgi:ribulose-phosphate 3-epimerase